MNIAEFDLIVETIFGSHLRANSKRYMDFENPSLRDWARRFVARRCPGLSVKEMEEAAQNLLDYMQVVWEIHQRLSGESSETWSDSDPRG